MKALKLDFDDVHERSAPVAAFSNGTEGDAWTAVWCFTCKHDTSGIKLAPKQKEIFCPILSVAMLDRTPAELTDRQSGELGGRYCCTQYDVRPGEQDARGFRPNVIKDGAE